jgi:hypothetical protein
MLVFSTTAESCCTGPDSWPPLGKQAPRPARVRLIAPHRATGGAWQSSAVAERMRGRDFKLSCPSDDRLLAKRAHARMRASAHTKLWVSMAETQKDCIHKWRGSMIEESWRWQSGPHRGVHRFQGMTNKIEKDSSLLWYASQRCKLSS